MLSIVRNSVGVIEIEGISRATVKSDLRGLFRVRGGLLKCAQELRFKNFTLTILSYFSINCVLGLTRS